MLIFRFSFGLEIIIELTKQCLDNISLADMKIDGL